MAGKTFNLNPALQAQWKAAISELASIANKTSPENVQKLVTLSAKRFVKNVVAITPPAKGKADSSAKKRGEATIDVDTGLTMDAMSSKELSALQEFHGGAGYVANALRNKAGKVYLEDRNFILWDAQAALAFHMKKRSASSGRPGAAAKGRTGGTRIRSRDAGAHNQHIGRSKSDDIAQVPPTVLAQVRKMLKQRVGWLAAGLNPAAQKLGVPMPAWIKRHGTKHGKIEVTASRAGLRIRIIQNVPFADAIRGYSRQWDFALQKEIKSLVAQAKVIFKKKAARAQARLARKS